MVNERVRELVGLTVFGVGGEFAETQFDKEQSGEADEFGRLCRDALVEGLCFQIAHHQAVDWRQVLIEMQAVVSFGGHLAAFQSQSVTVGRGNVKFAEGADRQVFENPVD